VPQNAEKSNSRRFLTLAGILGTFRSGLIARLSMKVHNVERGDAAKKRMDLVQQNMVAV